MSEQSVAYLLMRDAIRASQSTSWVKINGERRALLYWMISAGVKFEPDDLIVIGKAFRGGFWFPATDDALEWACAAKNKAAIVAISQEAGRPIWKWETSEWEKVPSHVLHVGAEIRLDNGERHRVTSFGDKGQTLIACTYHPHEAGKPERVKSRRTLTFEEAAEITKARRAAIRAAKKGPPQTYEAMLERCERAMAEQLRDPKHFSARDVLVGVAAEIRAMTEPEQRLLDLAASIEAEHGAP